MSNSSQPEIEVTPLDPITPKPPFPYTPSEVQDTIQNTLDEIVHPTDYPLDPTNPHQLDDMF